VVGVQWHPEHKVLENPLSIALFAAFARACAASFEGDCMSIRAA
jgi:putative glutamine amidotransferase